LRKKETRRELVFVSLVGYLTKLLVSGLHNVHGRKIDEYEAVGGMKISKGNRISWNKPDPEPLCSPQIPYDLSM
jgi:hypothetical protein